MLVSGQLHDLAALHHRERTPVSIAQEVWSAPEPAWMGRERSLTPAEDCTTFPHLSSPQPSHYITLATPFCLLLLTKFSDHKMYHNHNSLPSAH